MGVWFEEGGYLPSESEEETEATDTGRGPERSCTGPEDPELTGTEGSNPVPVRSEPVRLRGLLVSEDDHEEGELEWKKPDLKGWDPKPELVLYGGARRGLGGKGARVVGDRVPDLAAQLHSEDQRRRNEALALHGTSTTRPGYLLRCLGGADLPKELRETVEDKRKRDQLREELLQLQYDHGLKKWGFPTGRVASDHEVQLHHSLQDGLEYEYGQRPEDRRVHQYRRIEADRGLKRNLAARSNKPPS